MKRRLALFEAFLLDDGLEQPMLVGEIDVERALRDAGRAGDLAHAGAVEAQIQEQLARPVEVCRRFELSSSPTREGCASGMQPFVQLFSQDPEPKRLERGRYLWFYPREYILDRTVRSMVI